MRRIRVILALSLLLVGLLAPGAATGATASTSRVVVVVVPPISWSDVTSGAMPATERLAGTSSVGLLADHEADIAAALGKRFAAELPADRGEIRVVSGGITEIDAAVDAASSSIGEQDTLIIISAASGPAGRSERLGVAIIRGPLYPSGLLNSVSTHRKGLVTADDMIGSMLRALGLDSGVAAECFDDGRSPTERVSRLTEIDVSVGAAERMRISMFNIYTIAMAALLLAGWLVAERFRTARRFAYWSLVLRRALLFGLSMPAGATILFAVDRYPESAVRIIGLMLAATGFVWIFAEFAWHRWRTAGAIGLIGTVTAVVLATDQLLGAPLSLAGVFSYSPVAAFRFFGIGNEGAALLVGAAIVGIALELDSLEVSATARRLVIAGTGVVAVGVCVLPAFGANVIVSLWGTAAFAAFYLAAEGRRPGILELVAVVAVALGAVVLAVLLDRFGGGTHIGRAINDVSGSGVNGLIAERISTSIRIFTASPLPAIVLAIAGAFAYMRARARGEMARVLSEYPVFAAAVVGGLVGGFVGAFAEDSGIVVLALVLMYSASALVALMLEPEGELGV